MINLPTKQECMHLIKVTYRMPQNIIDHSIQVNKVAVFLATKLKEKNIEINLDLVDRASILHDIMKMIEIDPIRGLIFPENKAFTISKKDRSIWMDMKKRYGHLTHEEAAYKIFKEKYPEMALIIKKHGYTNLEGENKLNTIEEKLVHYADKRVSHSNIVPMKERLNEGHVRYKEKNLLKGIDEEFIKIVDEKLVELEKEIFNKLDFSPEEIPKLI